MHTERQPTLTVWQKIKRTAFRFVVLPCFAIGLGLGLRQPAQVWAAPESGAPLAGTRTGAGTDTSTGTGIDAGRSTSAFASAAAPAAAVPLPAPARTTAFRASRAAAASPGRDISTNADIDYMVLTLSYTGIGRVYLTVLFDYNEMRFLLPVTELLRYMEIQHSRNGSRGLIEGVFLTGGEPFSMNFEERTVRLGSRQFTYDADRMMPGETDYFIDPLIFEEVFDMTFDINLSTLSVRLITPRQMPVTERRLREEARRNIQQRAIERVHYPLQFNRSNHIFSAGFADYQVSTTGLLNNPSPDFSYSVIGGAEVLGGALQGSFTGSYTEAGGLSYRSDNFRWRYALNPNPWLTEINAGQISTGGPQGQRIRGISVTNDPIESRQLYGTYIFEGRTEAESEVELYFNNTLIDFTKADQLGFYRFQVPLRYGTSRLETRIITPSGDLRVREREVIIPFTFLPVGTLGYRAEAGVTESAFGPLGDTGMALHADLGYGFTEWLTARAGVDYSETDSSVPLLYSSATARVFGSYLINAEAVPGAFYRAQSSVVFPRSQNISLSYTLYDGSSRFNRQGAQQQITGSVYTPVPFINSGFRMSTDAVIFSNRTQARLTSDFFTRLGRVGLRFNYRSQLLLNEEGAQFRGGILRGSASYNFPRTGVPVLLRGLSVRSSLLYEPEAGMLRQADAQLSRGLGRTGRFTLGSSYQVQTGVMAVQFGLNLDLGGRARSSTDYRGSAGTHSYRQTFRGSVGLDLPNAYLQLTDRQQTGQSAVSVTLFVDNSGSGTFEPENGDEILPYNAVRLDRTSRNSIGSDGRLRLTQLQSFHRYNLEINRRAIPNPMIVPAMDRFSFVADPNSYKQIHIPFHRTGVLDGQVMLHTGSELLQDGPGGLRIIMAGTENDFAQTIRTFHGGGFYAMDIPPGRYTLEVDPVQLDFLGMVARDGALEISVEGRPHGHFLDGLLIVLQSEDLEVTPVEELLAAETEPLTEETDPAAMEEITAAAIEAQILTGIFTDLDLALSLFDQAQTALFEGRFAEARDAATRSLALFESDYGLALLGSIEFMLGNREEALRLWNEAQRRNPSIELPNQDVLELIMQNNR